MSQTWSWVDIIFAPFHCPKLSNVVSPHLAAREIGNVAYCVPEMASLCYHCLLAEVLVKLLLEVSVFPWPNGGHRAQRRLF